MSETQDGGVLRFTGCSHFRQRLACSLLSGKKLHITRIRADSLTPGLQDHEISFLRLVDKITNGTIVEINETGTEVKFKPGVLVGGKLQHTCPVSRSVGYFIEGILGLAPFTKNPLTLILNGITNNNEDISVDVLRTVTLPLLEKFGVTMDLKIKKRGAPPKGGGMVIFSCSVVSELTAVQMTNVGLVKRIRGIAFSTRVTPQTSNRIVESSKEVLKQFCQKVYIHTDHYKGADSGLSPGFGVALVAETTTGGLYSADSLAEAGSLPEDIGKLAAHRLLEEIYKGGFVDSTNQSILLLFMTLCREDVSKIVLGSLSEYTIRFLRHLRDFFGIKFKIVTDRETGLITLSCLGIGYSNYSRKVW